MVCMPFRDILMEIALFSIVPVAIVGHCNSHGGGIEAAYKEGRTTSSLKQQTQFPRTATLFQPRIHCGKSATDDRSPSSHTNSAKYTRVDSTY